MATIVVGGHARNVGKTSIVEGVISAFPQYSWTAIKLSSHRHQEFSDKEGDEIYVEKDRVGNSDTSRFLAAGAARSLWAQIGEANAELMLPKLLSIIKSDPFVIIESNYILKFVRPDLYIVVLRCDVEEFKDSAKQTLNQADAAVLLNSVSFPPAWQGFRIEALKNIPVFPAGDPQSVPTELIDFIQSRLAKPQ